MPRPHITIYLDLPPDIAIRRAKKRAEEKGEVPDAVESDHGYIHNSHEAGLFYAKKFNWLIIPGVRKDGHEYTEEEISQVIISKVRSQFGLCF